MKILWMTPKWTFPVTDGARVATDSLIRNTISAGAEVDVLCLAAQDEQFDPEEMKGKWKVKDVKVVKRPIPTSSWRKKIFYSKSFLNRPHIPLTFSSFSNTQICHEIIRTINSSDYDFILLDGLHLGIPFLGKKIKSKIIYRAHNIETDLWKKASIEKKNPFFKLFLSYQARLVEKYEKHIIRQSAGVAAISQDDLMNLKEWGSSETKLIPLGLSFDRFQPFPEKDVIRFLFIGRLDWPPNKDGLAWFLKEVWPEVFRRRPEARLKIVGSGDRSWLQDFAQLPGVELVGFVDSIEDAYLNCHFTIAPIFYGSGTRIKVLESFSMGRRLISTKMGVQGADLTESDYVQAESKEEWVEALSLIQFNQEQIQKLNVSRQRIASQFCEKKVGFEFYSWLKTLS